MVKLSAHASAEQLLTATSYQVERERIDDYHTHTRAEIIYMLHVVFP